MNLKLSFCLLSLLCFLSCKSQSFKSHPAIDFAIADMWLSDTCAIGNRAKLVDHLLETPLSVMDTSLAHRWFGQPIHRRLLKNGDMTYVYYYSGSPDSESCKYGDLFCIEFDSNTNFKTNYIYFITEDEQTTFFWYSDTLPYFSVEGTNDNKFFLNMPK